MPEGVKVEIKPAKGRPMLTWVGKRPLRYVTAFPAQHIETFDPTGDAGKRAGDAWSDWPANYPRAGLLFHGDNKEVLAHLLANGYRGKVKLIYIDPPFNTGVDYVRKVTPRGIRMEKLEGEGYSFTEQVQYSNNWHIDAYLQFLYERLQLAKEILAEDGIIFIRMDVHFGYYLRLIADEVFGSDLFQNEVVVNRTKKNVTEKGRRTIPHAVDHLYVYFKSLSAEYKYVKKRLSKSKSGYWHAMESAGVPGPRQVVIEGKKYLPTPGRHFSFTQEQVDEMYAGGRIRVNDATGKPEYLVEEKDFEYLDSAWTDIPGYTFKTGYPTENSEQLLERVIMAGSLPGDLVMDFFIGSGTTAAMAQKLGRRWIGCDINKGAIQTTAKRLQNIISEQIKNPAMPGVKTGGKDDPTELAQLSFAVYRVNDYDLQIQHNEAVNLACEHIGITRTKSDAFFDGTLGKRLAKIIPFNHPLTPLDLEEVRRELGARPEEERDIVVVCLGKEIAVDGWLDDWNRLRKQKDFPNKIEVIELRTDPKYGKFFVHQPAQARVSIKRVRAKGASRRIRVEVKDFISPTIIERLKQQEGILTPQIDDWRAMVDSVMIDFGYNGQVFNITLSDVPERKNDLVKGEYELDAPKGETTVAVKITDMLGEEVLVTQVV
jgi:DNA modification methylase